MKLLIRESIPADEPAVRAVALASAPASPLPEASRYWDSPRQFQRWIAKWDGRRFGIGQIVAFAEYTQSPDSAREFWVNVCVHPDARGRGIGATLYTHLLNALLPHGPLALKSSVHPTQAEAVRFLTARGYRVEVEGHVHRPDGHVTLVKLFESAGEIVWNP
jgi:GNAT superfamily N-acetyltransferase